MGETAKRRRGRPADPESQRRVENLTLRIRPETKEALERHAAKHGRSLSAEVELRLGQTLDSDNLLDQVLDLAFGRQGAGVMLLLGRLLGDVTSTAAFMKTHTLAGAHAWLEVPYAFDQAKEAVDAVFEALYPEGDREPPKGFVPFPGDPDFDDLNKRLGAGFATTYLKAVIEGGLTIEHSQLAEKVRERLGPAAVERIKEWISLGGVRHG